MARPRSDKTRAVTLIESVEQDGFKIVPGVLSLDEISILACALGDVSGAGRRGLLGSPAVTALASSLRLLGLVRPHVSTPPRPVRAIYFDKSPATNWLVTWHQDLTLVVRTPFDVPGFGPWSVKDGVQHVQPPVGLLEKMLTVRLHLDDCDENNGALRVLPGTHRLGRLDAQRIRALREQQEEIVCDVAAGGALIMRPLLLHASGRSRSNRHRRVLHIEYAAFTLPEPLEWHEPVEPEPAGPPNCGHGERKR